MSKKILIIGDLHCGSMCGLTPPDWIVSKGRNEFYSNLQKEMWDNYLEMCEDFGKVDALTSWAADVKEYALQQAISGKEWTGWKLVEGRSNRKYTSEADVAAAVESVGLDPYERKVLGVTAMQKLLGKTRFEELLSPYIEKPQGKPTLVLESDKRPAMNTAKNDFMEEF